MWSRVRDARRIWQWNRERNRECASDFVQILGKSATETLEMIQQGFGDQSFSRTQVFQWHARFKTGRTSAVIQVMLTAG
jgi:hypothetical protein